MPTRTTTSAIAAALFALAAPVAAQPGPRPPEGPVVLVQGAGEVKAAPDQAFVTIGAETQASTPQQAQEQTTKAMTGVQERIAAAGIPKDAVRTIAYDLQPQYDYNNGRQTLRGYLARNVVEVRIDDLARLPRLLEGVVTSGATTVHGIRFDLKERVALERLALTRAVADAKARAEAAATGAGLQVAAVLRIEEHGVRQGPIPMPGPQYRAGMAAMAADAAPPIAPGETTITANVTLTVALK
jgi:uncharacterized protein YggE